jgi:hypothetical protein
MSVISTKTPRNISSAGRESFVKTLRLGSLFIFPKMKLATRRNADLALLWLTISLNAAFVQNPGLYKSCTDLTEIALASLRVSQIGGLLPQQAVEGIVPR